MSEANPQRKSFRSIWPAYRPYLKYVKPDWPLMVLDYFTIFIAVVTNTLMIWLIGKPFNLLQQGKYEQVIEALVLFGIVVLINQLFQLWGGLLTNKISYRIIGRMRNAVLERILFLSFPVINKMSRGDLLARLSNDVDVVKGVVFDSLLFIISHVLTLGIYIFMLFWIDTQLAIWALAISPLYLIHQRMFAPYKRQAAEKFLKNNGRLLGYEEQAIAHTRGINNYTAEPYIINLHKKVFEKARYWITRENNINLLFGITFTFMIYATGLVIVLLGIDGIRENRFGLGHLVSFLLYLGYLTVPSRGFADITFQCVGALGASQRLEEIFKAKPAASASALQSDLHISNGQISINNLTFAYETNTPIYRDLNLVINGGETIALVGPSGSGKTTVTNIITRYLEPQQGTIEIDGQNIRNVSLKSLRQHITIVTQEPFLLSETIKENLVMVKPNATDEQIIHACKNSFAWEFIEKMQHGIDTVIGDDGVDLSTGQKQRLSLSQAFLRDTPILIMDEATSALDSQSEQMVIEALQKLRQGRTTLIIAHRYSSIKSADRVVYFNGDGTITVGKHEELMQSHQGYQQAVQWQTQREE
ncbi:ABC transporter ATP-binding protein [Kaarinaea lacus]